MKRSIVAFLAGLVVWILAIWVFNRALRLLLAGYAAAELSMSFSAGMLVSRLLIAALGCLIAGAVAAWIAPASSRMPLLLGSALLIAFVPVHARLWSLFPLWYHLVFLGTLVPLIVLGSKLPRRRAAAEAAARC